MTRRRLKTLSGDWMLRAKLIVLSAMMMNVIASCATTRGQIQPIESQFCARYFDKAHPPVWIYQSDSETEKEEKTDLIILWERECAIRPED